MPSVFTRSLAPNPAPEAPAKEPTVFEKIMQELAGLEKQDAIASPAMPAMPLDQQRANVGRNNDAMQLGLLGQMSGAEGPQNVGAQVFKQAMARNEPRISEKGTTDQLTGEFVPNQDVTEQRNVGRRDRIFKMALTAEDARRRGEERQDAATQAQNHREDMIRLSAGLRSPKSGADAEMTDLKKELTQAQIDATRARVDAAGDKRTAAADKAQLSFENAAGSAKVVLGKLDEADKLLGRMTTGVGGKIFKSVPGTDAYNLDKTVDTIKANIGFDRLQEMRRASPTGGALGQVAVKELDMLQATIASLDTGQDAKTLRKNIQQVRTHYNNWLDAMAQHGRSMSAAPGVDSAPGVPSQPAPGALPAPPARGGQRLRYDPATGGFQ